jgi:23S rRNA (pseudouridine1915-N3)-methyltransferase
LTCKKASLQKKLSNIKKKYHSYHPSIPSMKWQIITVGKPALPWAKAAVLDYQERLKHVGSIEFVILKEGTQAQNAQRALEASAGAWRVVLDERGRQFRSEEFARWIGKQEMSGRKRVSFLIGGADGHDPSVREAADELWSLSNMTLQHELAYVVLLEQIYRAINIQQGGPYHRP